MAWQSRPKSGVLGDRLAILRIVFAVFAFAIATKVGFLMIVHHGFYAALAQDQHQLSEELIPTRGQILVHDTTTATGTYPLAANKTLHLLYAIPKQIQDPHGEADKLKPFVTLSIDDLLKRLDKPNDLYEPIQHYLTDEQMKTIGDLKLPGLAFADETTRYYPEQMTASQLLGFVGYKGDVKVGRYGVEEAEEKLLAGQQGFIKAEKDASGQLIASAAEFWQPAINGSNILLTIDRAVEHEACKQLDEAVQKHGATGGSVLIMNPKTGAIIAMCGAPDFNPNDYSSVTDANTFLNAATQITYEPGSIFKAFTMAAALDAGKITPDTTYTDTGEVKVGSFTIKNSDLKAHGVQTMTYVLQESLNTGAIFAMQQIGAASFNQYVQKFGFGSRSGIEIPEAAGNISPLATGKDIYAMTGSFGQGITVTPLQILAAYGALANGGTLMKPYIIDQVIHPDGTIDATKPVTVRQVISPKAASLVDAMLVNVVVNGHGKKAAVPGYFVAGKTGTAQVPDPNGAGYLKNVTIGTFAGFAPVEDPKFVMVVKIDKPQDVQFAESSAAPLFGSLAKFLLSYYNVVPTNPVK